MLSLRDRCGPELIFPKRLDGPGRKNVASLKFCDFLGQSETDKTSAGDHHVTGFSCCIWKPLLLLCFLERNSVHCAASVRRSESNFENRSSKKPQNLPKGLQPGPLWIDSLIPC